MGVQESEGLTIVGRLVHACPDRIPIHHMRVEIFDRDFGPDDRLGHTTTGLDGRFELVVDPKDAGRWDRPDLRLVVVDHPWDMFVDDGVADARTVASFDGPDDFEGARHDFGDLEVSYWEYMDGPLARLDLPPEPSLLGLMKELKIGVSAIKDLLRIDQETKPQRYARGYVEDFAATSVRVALVRAKHEAIHIMNDHLPELSSIQEDYPDSLTLEMERIEPGSSRSDAHFCDRLLNGFNPILPLRHAQDPTRLRVVYDWTGYAKDGEHDLPNVDLELALEDGRLRPVSIKSELEGWKRETLAGDGEDWERAKRLFRVSYLTAGETDAHLSRGHLNAEQYAVAAFRNLRQSPLRELLFPHLKEVVLTNHRGASLIFGGEGVLTTNSALTAGAVDQRLVEEVGELDWKGWAPRAPLCSAHRIAEVANLFWGILGDHVKRFFTHFDQDLRAHWSEVVRFSEDLVAHSAPFTQRTPPAGWESYDKRELSDPTLERPSVNGVRRAVSPIATSDTPSDEQLADLAQAARYAIYHATFWHSWSHNRQVDDGGELRYSSLGLRNGSWSSEFDIEIAPNPQDSTVQLFMAHVLGGVQYGYITQDEDKDIPFELSKRLADARAAFAEHGFDVDELRSRVNI